MSLFWTLLVLLFLFLIAFAIYVHFAHGKPLESRYAAPAKAKPDPPKSEAATRIEATQVPSDAKPATAAAPATAPEPVAASASAGNGSIPAAEGAPDDLKKISGVGPKLEEKLNGLGITQFRQIAAFTPEQVAWVDDKLAFKGRIERDDWIGQAKELAGGG